MFPTNHGVGSETKRARSFWRSWKLRLTLLGLVVLSVLGLLFILPHWDQYRLSMAIEAADELDPGWRIRDLEARRASLSNEPSAAIQLTQALGKLPNGWPSFFQSLPTPESMPAKPHGIEELRDLFEMGVKGIPPPEMFPVWALESLYAARNDAQACLDDVRAAMRLPAGKLPIAYNREGYDANLGVTQRMRTIEAALRLDALLRLQHNDLEGAMESAHASLVLARTIGGEPFVVSMLIRQSIRSHAVRTIERVVAQGELSPATLASLQQLCQEESEAPLYLIGMRGNRATSYALMEAVEAKALSFAQLQSHLDVFRVSYLSKEYLSLVEVYYLPGATRRVQASLLEFQNRQVEVAKLPVEKQVQEWPALNAAAKELPVIARMIVEPTLKIADAFVANLAQMRCLVAVLAAERFRQSRGRWPETIEEMTPAFLSKPLLDPFTGKPLILRRTDDGIVIYSVSSDGRDDGGTFLPNYRAPGSDVGVRLWDPAKRRQPSHSIRNN
jgi:hypothetical protein